MSETDKLFEELGYKKVDMGVYSHLNMMYEKENGDFINFILAAKGFIVSENNVIFSKELKAINAKVKELGWI